MDNSRSYESVPYPDFVHPRTNPDSIAAMARLYGFTSAPVASCRILELGCGQGGNLISLASLYPQSQCLGIDLSSGHIQAGQATLEQLGLTNVQLHAGDIADFPGQWFDSPEDAKFDYIIVYGVYSWVPENIRQQVLRIAAEQLSDRGVALISYNTYPGWHAKGMVREMMRHHAEITAELAQENELKISPLERIVDAKGFLADLAHSVPETSGYGRILREEFRNLSRSHEAYLFHEQFETVNQPRYFHQFVAETASSGLRYLCESSLTHVPAQTDAMRRRLAALSVLDREQLIDYLCNRTFRQSVLCRSDRAEEFSSEANPHAVRNLWLSSDVTCLGNDEEPLRNSCADLPEGELRIASPDGASATLTRPITQAALLHLASIRPENLSYDQLWQHLSEHLPALTSDDSNRTWLCTELLQLAQVSMVHFSTTKLPLTTDYSRPLTSKLARLQAAAGEIVTSQRHVAVRLDSPTRHLITLCDGTRDFESLTTAMVRFVTRDGNSLQHQGRAVTDPELVTQLVREKIEPNLKNLAEMGFLIPPV